MGSRIAASVVLLCAGAVLADVVVKRDGKVIGLNSEIEERDEKIKVTVENFARWMDQSKGEIVLDGYAAIEFARGGGGKKETIARDDVAGYAFAARPEALDDGLTQMGSNAWGQAIAAFREVLADGSAREPFRTEAEFRIGQCLLGAGNVRAAVDHYSKWRSIPSVYTPEVYRILAQIQNNERQFADARKWFGEIEKLAGVPQSWVFTSRLGLVGVDIAERKFAEAETALRQVIAQVGSDPKLVNSRAEASVLLARLILESAAKDRFGEARKALEAASALPGLSEDAAGGVHSTLGDIIYAGGDPDGARFPYMRVVLMFRGASQYAGHALNNAGKCFLDLSGRAEKTDPEAANRYFKEGYLLLQQCAAQYRGTADAKEAAATVKRVKDRYDALPK